MAGLCHLCLAGPSVKDVPGYGMTVCIACWQRAESGWPRELEPALFNALDRAGLLIPDRNPAGLLPRVYAPPEDFSL